jgi:transcriptional regulator with XRE-family HTH domain
LGQDAGTDRQMDGKERGGVATQNPQRVELGETLRRARLAAELAPGQVEQELGWYPGKVSRVERGDRVPVRAEVARLAELYHLDAGETERLHLLADAARKRESPARVADFAQSYITMERAAVEVDYYDAELVWGAMETERYARALISTVPRNEDVEASVAGRTGRHELLVRDAPPRVRVLLGEAVLHRLVGGEETLVEQLEHLLAVAELPTVQVRILPFSIGAHQAMGVGFTRLRLDRPAIGRVYIEGITDATYIADPAEVAIYEQDFNDLWSIALDDDASANILRRRIGTR